MYVSWQNRRSTVLLLLLLLLLLLTTGLAWRLVQKLQGHVTHTKKTTCSVDRQRNNIIYIIFLFFVYSVRERLRTIYDRAIISPISVLDDAV